MSDVIDWSKAPEGYPLWIEGFDSCYASGWYRELSDRYQSTHGTYYIKRDAGYFTVHERPQPAKWNGEGLPPVGVVLEVNPDKAGWRKSVISYVGDGFIAWMQVGDLIVPEYGAFIDDCEFRPIRTPEQIAADEREAAIERACADIEKRIEGFNVQLSYSLAIRATIEAMIDKGYRKP